MRCSKLKSVGHCNDKVIKGVVFSSLIFMFYLSVLNKLILDME